MKDKMAKRKNPLVYMDVSIDGHPVEKMIFELFSDVAPQTAENFRALCTGEKGIGPKLGKPLHYKGTFFHHIVKGSMAEGGDFLRREGSAGESIYGDKFPDELPKLQHGEPGLLTMSIADRNTRGSIFNLTFKPNHNLDRKHLVFGKLVHGHEVLKKIEDAGVEEGRSDVTVKIINCGECNESDRKKLSKFKSAKDVSSEANSSETRNKRKHKKSAKDKRKRRRKYYASESDSSSYSDLDSSESDSDSDVSSSTDISSSSDDRHQKRKRNSRHGKKKDRRLEKKRRRRDRKPKRRLRSMSSDSHTDTENEESVSSSEEDEIKGKTSLNKCKEDLQKISNKGSPSIVEKEAADNHHSRSMDADLVGEKELKCPMENGDRRSHGYERDATSSRDVERQPDVVDDLPGKSRSRSMSPKRAMSKSVSIGSRSVSRSHSISPIRRISRSLSVSRSPQSPSRGAPRAHSISISPVRRGGLRSKARSVSRSSARDVGGSSDRSVSRSPMRHVIRSSHRSVSRSPPRRISRRSPKRLSRKTASMSPSPYRRSPSKSPLRTSSRRSVGRSPVISPRRSVSPLRSSRRSISRSSGRISSRRGVSPSPVRFLRRTRRRSYSRSHSPVRRARLPPSERRRSLSRSRSPDVSPKRIRRGRGFSEMYSYARRYRTPSPDRSPIRSYRYGRNERDRYSSYRRYPDRSPRRYRSPRRSPRLD